MEAVVAIEGVVADAGVVAMIEAAAASASVFCYRLLLLLLLPRLAMTVCLLLPLLLCQRFPFLFRQLFLRPADVHVTVAEEVEGKQKNKACLP